MYFLVVCISLMFWLVINSKYKIENNVTSLPTVISLILIFSVPFVTMVIFGLVYLFLWLKANYFSSVTNQRINKILKDSNIYNEFYNEK